MSNPYGYRASHFSRRQPGIKIAAIGTSLVQYNSNATSTKISNYSRGPIAWAQVKGPEFVYGVWHDTTDVNGRNFTGANHGVSGETSTQIIARLAALVAMLPDIVIVDNGTNEMATDSYDTIIANSETIYKTLIDAGMQVIILPVLARATSSWASGSETRKKAQRVNAWKRWYAAKTPACMYFDWNQPWVDPASADGEPLTGYSDDGIHENVKGAYYIGKALATYLTGFLPPRQPLIVGQDDDYDATYNPMGNIFPNPMMQGTAGVEGTGATGDTATSCRIERSTGSAVTVVAAKETRSDNNGDWQVLTFTPSGSALERFLLRTSTADMTHSFAAGTWVQAACDIDVAAYSGWKSIQLYLKDQGTGGVTGLALEEYDNAGTLQPFPTEAWSGKLVTPPFQIVSGSTALRTRVEMELDGAVAGSPVIKVGSWRVSAVLDPRKVWNT